MLRPLKVGRYFAIVCVPIFSFFFNAKLVSQIIEKERRLINHKSLAVMIQFKPFEKFPQTNIIKIKEERLIKPYNARKNVEN